MILFIDDIKASAVVGKLGDREARIVSLRDTKPGAIDESDKANPMTHNSNCLCDCHTSQISRLPVRTIGGTFAFDLIT